MKCVFPIISLIAAGALTLGGCAYGDLGYGVGYGGGYGSVATAVMAATAMTAMAATATAYSYGTATAHPITAGTTIIIIRALATYVYDLYRKPHAGADASGRTGCRIAGSPQTRRTTKSGELDRLHATAHDVTSGAPVQTGNGAHERRLTASFGVLTAGDAISTIEMKVITVSPF